MTLEDQVIKSIVTRVIKAQDYRIEVVNLINAEFLQFAIDFFKKVIAAKLNSENITIEWYKKAFTADNLQKTEIAINSGLNMKTIENMFQTTKKQVVIDASAEHFEALYHSILALVENESEMDMTLTLKLKGVSVDLDISESLIVINTLAVKRAALRGGLWSTAGKRSEKILMLALCKLFKVNESNYNAEHFIRDRGLDVDREIDFFLKANGQEYKCEVKLMGRGNPESADAIIARGSNVFIADTLSLQNKSQCDQLGIKWIACRDDNGFQKFKSVLDDLGIPNENYNGSLDVDLPLILDSIFDE